MSRVAVALALACGLGLAACGGTAPLAPGPPPPSEAAVAACADALAAASDRPASEAATIVATGCGGDQAALGADPADLGPAQAALATPAWRRFARAGEWVAAAYQAGVGRARLAPALAGLGFAVPLPAAVPGLYAAPAARAREPSRARWYLVVTGDRLGLGRAPRARLTRLGAELDGDFPGEPLAATALADRAAALGVSAAPLVLADRALPALRLFVALRALGPLGGRLAVAGDGLCHRVLLHAADHATGATLALDARVPTVAALAQHLDELAAGGVTEVALVPPGAEAAAPGPR